MASIATTTETFGGGDYRWLDSARGTEHPKSATLDISAFTEGTHFPDGYVKSGQPVTFLAASGLYGPATTPVASESEVVTLTEGGSGLTSWTATFGGQTTSSLDDDATPAQVEAALEALSTIGAGNVEVWGSTNPIAMTVRFTGDLASADVGAITTTPTGGTGTVVVAVVDAGVDGVDGFVLHDEPTDGTNDPVVSIITDATIVAAHLPVDIGLSDGRYICDLEA